MQLISFDDLKNQPVPGWRVDNVIQESSVSLLYAERGVGKSFLALDWALSVLEGESWLGRTTKLGQVLYIAAEGSTRLGSRVEAWKLTHGHDHAIGGYVLPQALQIHRASEVNTLAQMLGEIPFALIVIDTVARCFVGGDEDRAQDVGVFIAGLDSLRRQSDADVLCVHHSGWKNIHERGSTALGGAMDTIMQLKRSGLNNELTLHCDKQKDAPEFEDIKFRLVAAHGSCVLIESGNIEQRLIDTLKRLGGSAPAPVWFEACEAISRASFYRHLSVLKSSGILTQVDGRYILASAAT